MPAGSRSILFSTRTHRALAGADLGEHRLDDRRVLRPVRVRASTTCSSRSARAHLLERALEGLDELVRQLVDEADRVDEQHRQRRSGRREAADGRIEGREELVLDQHAGAGQRFISVDLPALV